jgi:hypothetical protein
MITKKFGVDFEIGDGALTLHPSEVTETDAESGIHTRTHADGWTITGEIHEDYYTWVNAFEATHPTLGRVWGDFENEVFADNDAGFAHFYKHHQPEAWDYGDI